MARRALTRAPSIETPAPRGREWRPLAEQGDAVAQNNLGVMYSKGEGVTQDYAEAVKWFRKAAKQGYSGAQLNIGYMYDQGQGVTQDYQTAISWYCKAVKQGDDGDTDAMHNLGVMYGNGVGVIQDYVQAHKWFNLAAARSKPGEDRDKRVKKRDLAASMITPADISQAQRLAREWTDDKPCP